MNIRIGCRIHMADTFADVKPGEVFRYLDIDMIGGDQRGPPRHERRYLKLDRERSSAVFPYNAVRLNDGVLGSFTAGTEVVILRNAVLECGE